MNIIINDISILSELVDKTINRDDLNFMGITFHTIPSALDKNQRNEAKRLEQAHVLTCHSLNDEEDTLWIIDHYSGNVCFDDLYIIRYALTHDTTILTNDPVFTNMARSLGAKVVDAVYLKEAMEDNVVADEAQTDTYLARIFRNRHDHWIWFRSQHIQLSRIDVLL